MKIKYQYTTKAGTKRTETVTREEAKKRLERNREVRRQTMIHAPTHYGVVDFNADQEIAAIEAAL